MKTKKENSGAAGFFLLFIGILGILFWDKESIANGFSPYKGGAIELAYIISYYIGEKLFFSIIALVGLIILFRKDIKKFIKEKF